MVGQTLILGAESVGHNDFGDWSCGNASLHDVPLLPAAKVLRSQPGHQTQTSLKLWTQVYVCSEREQQGWQGAGQPAVMRSWV